MTQVDPNNQSAIALVGIIGSVERRRKLHKGSASGFKPVALLAVGFVALVYFPGIIAAILVAGPARAYGLGTSEQSTLRQRGVVHHMRRRGLAGQSWLGMAIRRAGKATQNEFGESFNGRLREEVFDEHLIAKLA